MMPGFIPLNHSKSSVSVEYVPHRVTGVGVSGILVPAGSCIRYQPGPAQEGLLSSAVARSAYSPSSCPIRIDLDASSKVE